MENSTPATSFPLLPARSAKSMMTLASKLVTNLARTLLTAKTDFGKSMLPLASQPQQERGRLSNHAVPVQACAS